MSSNTKKIRMMRSYSKQSFLNELFKIDWSSILSSADVNFCLTKFSRLFCMALDKVAPFREIRVRNRKNPWMNGIILAGIKKRDRLFSCFKKDRNNQALYKDYCRVRNLVQRDIKQAKEFYFKRKVEEDRKDSNKLWAHLKSLGYSKKSCGSTKIVLENTLSFPAD